MAAGESKPLHDHPVVPHDEWLRARRELLEKEKAFTRQRDELSRLQRALPWERVSKPYEFEGPDGKETLADLFALRSQLVIYHFMFHPDEAAGCPHCSLRADGFDHVRCHLGDPARIVYLRALLAHGVPSSISRRIQLTMLPAAKEDCSSASEMRQFAWCIAVSMADDWAPERRTS